MHAFQELKQASYASLMSLGHAIVVTMATLHGTQYFVTLSRASALMGVLVPQCQELSGTVSCHVDSACCDDVM